MDSIVIVGIETSGKTTLANSISKHTGITFMPEIGGIYNNKSNCTVGNRCEIFDEFIMIKEFERDKSIRRDNKKKVLIYEQWHIGNLAFAFTRSSPIARKYFTRFKKNIRYMDKITVLWLKISSDLMLQRKKENKIVVSDPKELQTFYITWEKHLDNILKEIKIHPIYINANQIPQKILNNTLSILHKNHVIKGK